MTKYYFPNLAILVAAVLTIYTTSNTIRFTGNYETQCLYQIINFHFFF